MTRIQKVIEELILEVLGAKAVEIRDVDGGDKAFLYSSGNFGPGYVTIKNLVGRKAIIKGLVLSLAEKVIKAIPSLKSTSFFVAGNVTGGVIPGWLLSQELEERLKKRVPFVYVEGGRAKGEQKVLIRGIENNPDIQPGYNVVVVEELVNFAETTCKSARDLRSLGYGVTHAACIMSYGNPNAKKALREHKIRMVHLFTLQQLLDVAEKNQTHSPKVIAGYREFLANPLDWQAKRGLEPVKEGGTK